MATNKMRLRHLYRSGEHEFLEEHYGIRFDKPESKAEVVQKVHVSIKEDEEIQVALKEEESEEVEIQSKLDYLETLDILQLRGMIKSAMDIPHKTVIKMKREEIISELLK